MSKSKEQQRKEIEALLNINDHVIDSKGDFVKEEE